MLETVIVEAGSSWSWVDSVISAVAVLFAVWIVVWQVGKQFENGQRLQRQNAREKLWLDIYREICSLITEAYSAQIDAHLYASAVTSEIGLWRSADFVGIPNTYHDRRAMKFMNLNTELSEKVSKLTRVLEQYEIIQPNLSLFRIAFNATLHDIRNSSNTLFSLYLRMLPTDIPENMRGQIGQDVVVPEMPTEAQASELARLSEVYEGHVHDLGGFIFDFQVEAQNNLLGDLFGNRVSRRRPADPDVVVVSTETPEEVEVLRMHFNENTDWGRHQSEIERELRAAQENQARLADQQNPAAPQT